MSETLEPRKMREVVAVVAGPRQSTDNWETWLRRAARKANISFRQTKSLYYGEINDPHHRSARLMRDAAEQRQQEAGARLEARSAVARLLALRQSLIAKDPDFYRSDISSLECALRAMGHKLGA